MIETALISVMSKRCLDQSWASSCKDLGISACLRDQMLPDRSSWTLGECDVNMNMINVLLKMVERLIDLAHTPAVQRRPIHAHNPIPSNLQREHEASAPNDHGY